MTPCREPLEYEQYLSDKLYKLYFEDERYSALRDLIQSECKDEVVFAVRKDEIHIYYLGGRILKITKAYNFLKLAIDLKYAKIKKGSDELNEYGDIIKKLNDIPYRNPQEVTELWIKHWGDLKHCMETYRDKVSHNDERKLQQKIELANRDFNNEVVVIDNEYGAREKRALSSKLCKVDLVTLYKDSGKYKICLVELKCGDGSIEGPAGVTVHINDFNTLIATRKADIIASVNNLIEYKVINRSLYNVPNGIRLPDDTEICGSILCYNLSETKKESVKASIEKQKIAFKLHKNLDLKTTCFKLTEKDILGE